MSDDHEDDLSDLSLVQRVLLATDGTVTHILEAYARERMGLVKLAHEMLEDPAERAELDLAAQERALRRVILLRGSESGVTFLHADSVMLLDRLHPVVADGLITTDTPIGKLMWKCRSETFREVLAVWLERAGPIGTHFGLHPSAPLVARTYQIVEGGQPIAWITERFPRHHFPAAPAVAPDGAIDLRSNAGLVGPVLPGP